MPTGKLTLRQRLRNRGVSEGAINKLSVAGVELDGEKVPETLLDLSDHELKLSLGITLGFDRSAIRRVIKVMQEGREHNSGTVP
jgi:hypothetical protein